MDLKDFVSQTITEISEGIIEAQKQNPNACVCPVVSLGEYGELSVVNSEHEKYASSINFDISVIIKEKDSIDGKAGIKVLAVSFGSGGSNEKQHTSTSRIQFTLPILWPKP